MFGPVKLKCEVCQTMEECDLSIHSSTQTVLDFGCGCKKVCRRDRTQWFNKAGELKIDSPVETNQPKD